VQVKAKVTIKGFVEGSLNVCLGKVALTYPYLVFEVIVNSSD